MTTGIAIDWPKARRVLGDAFDPKFVKFRPGREVGDKHQALAYIDARAVEDKLDEAFGPDGWSFSYDVLTWAKDKNGKDYAAFVRGTITVGGVSKSDIGEASNASPSKGAVSDAFKRAAVLWGVARYLYEHPVGLVKLNQWKKIDRAEEARLRAALPKPGDEYRDEEDDEDAAVEARSTQTQASTRPAARPATPEPVPAEPRTDAQRVEISKKNRTVARNMGLEDKPPKGSAKATYDYSREYAKFLGIGNYTDGAAILSTDEQVDDWTAELRDRMTRGWKFTPDPTGKLAEWTPEVETRDEPLSFPDADAPVENDLRGAPQFAASGKGRH